ncbi:glutathione S-transferase omega-1 [Fusarium sp. NRRL 52700]|nr:glutathione S-transferase omega-1 [Fusarium sp. NRRL 52700]
MAAPNAPTPGPNSGSGSGLSTTFSTPGLPPDYRHGLGLDLHGYVAPIMGEAYYIHAMHNGAAIATPANPGQFGILAPTAVPVPVMETPLDGIFSVQNNTHRQEGGSSSGHLSSKIIVDPPDLEMWRNKLFNVDETIVLTHEEFETYFPHVDNVYSHRSTQRYKRKPFISHYWDCRMKGRPPGTPKSDDPNKKKRKRNARQRDLCDVKIKITEYFPGARPDLDNANGLDAGLVGQRLWTIQRVNGNGGNGKGDGVAGPHKHTLERSDEIKRNSVQRKHAKESEFKLYAACFCPFSQRIWIALEAKGMPYQYHETDAFCRPTRPLLADPHGYVPTIKHGDWSCSNSAVILEYLEDLGQGASMLPVDSRLKAHCRFWIDHVRYIPPESGANIDVMEINRHIVPDFFKLLQHQDPALGDEARASLQGSMDTLIEAADKKGPYFLGRSMSLVDIHLAPFALRFSRTLVPADTPSSPPGSRWARWLDAIEGDESVRATTSNHVLYSETIDALMEQYGCRHVQEATHR